MRFAGLILASSLFALGCSDNHRSPWHHPTLNLNDVEAITLIASAYYLDGGTTEIYAITDSGKRCSIRLNQHSLLGDYELDKPDSPGRLCFNNRLIAVRSTSEQHVLELLQSAILKPIAIDDLRRIHELDNVSPSELSNLTRLVESGELERHRDSIVDFVETDRYVEAARSGIPYSPATDG